MRGVLPIASSYGLPNLAPGDYYFVEKEGPSLKRTDSAQYLILDNDKAPLLTAERSFLAGKLHSVVLATADVYRPVANISILGEDTYTVDIGGPVGTIEKTHGWQYRDLNSCVQFGIVRVAQELPSFINHLATFIVSQHPADEGIASIFRFWQRGSDEYFASYYADLNNLEIKTVESALTPYICIFLVLVNQLSVDNQA